MRVGRLAEPAEIAVAVSFLASPGAGALIGQVLQPNGGSTRAGPERLLDIPQRNRNQEVDMISLMAARSRKA